jgi:hypothetical protein
VFVLRHDPQRQPGDLRVAVDQLFGYAADPTTEYPTPAGAVVFGTLTLVNLIPLYFYFRRLQARSHLAVDLKVHTGSD